MTWQWKWTVATFSFFLFPFSLCASDWTHWRGPWQTGVSPETNLPDKVEGNVLWRVPYGSRSTPLVLGDRIYFINYDADKVKAGPNLEDAPETIVERVMCL